MSTAWLPERGLEIVAGTPPGGGLDRTARALQRAIAAANAGVPVSVRNVSGDGARKAWTYMDEHRGDPHVVSISHPNLTTDRLVGLATFDYRAYSPIAILYTEYIAFAVRSDSNLVTGADLLRRLGPDSSSLSVALSTALGNPNHIALARLIRHTGGDVKAPLVRVFDSALDAVADVVSGKSEVAAVTIASTAAALEAREIRILGVSAPKQVGGVFADVPTWRAQGVDCVIGAWRGVAGAEGIGESHVAFWNRLLFAALVTDAWKEDLSRHGWAPSYVTGEALRRYLDDERRDMAATLRDLGLVRN